jgi:hypothetical protein
MRAVAKREEMDKKQVRVTGADSGLALLLVKVVGRGTILESAVGSPVR